MSRFPATRPPRISLNLRRVRAVIRVPLGIASLLVILYFMLPTVGLVALLPAHEPQVGFRPDGVAEVIEAIPATPVSGSIQVTEVQPGDQLLAIDGLPYRNFELGFNYGPPADFHTYLLQRGDERYTVRITSGQPSTEKKLVDILYMLAWLEFWALGFLIVLFAPTDDDTAWLVGVVWLGLAIGAAGWWSDGDIPGWRLVFEGFLPIMTVGYLESAFVVGANPGTRGPRRLFRVLYGLVLIGSLLALIEIFILNPHSSWEAVRGCPWPTCSAGDITFETAFYLNTGIVIVLAPAVLVVRWLRQASPNTRRPITILLIGTVLTGASEIFWELGGFRSSGIFGLLYALFLPFMGALPAAYGYVIYRHRYLNLDLFVSRLVLVIGASMVISLLYLLGTAAAREFQAVAPIEPLVGMVILLFSFGIMAKVGGPLQHGLEWLLYGSKQRLEQSMKEITLRLSADPQLQTLKSVLLETVPANLQVRQAGLLFLNTQGMLVPVSEARLENKLTSLPPEEIQSLLEVVLRQVTPEAPVFQRYPWASVVVPLRFQAEVMGVWLLGPKVPDGQLDAQEVIFLGQIAAAAAIAAENVRLFEALRQLSQDLLRVRVVERLHLSARLHDEPLQRAAVVTYALERLLSTGALDGSTATVIGRQRDSVRQLSQDLRDICAGLRPPILDQGLEATLSEVVRWFRQLQPEIKIELVVKIEDNREPALSSEVMDAVYHIATEALNNIRKHAHADSVQIMLKYVAAEITLSITDNGSSANVVGLSLPELLRGYHFGLVGMYQWAEMANGQLQIGPADPHGTRVSLTLRNQSEFHQADAIAYATETDYDLD